MCRREDSDASAVFTQIDLMFLRPARIRSTLPAGVRSIGKIMPEILNRYGLSLDASGECQPQLPATAFVPIMPDSHPVLKPMAAVSS
jgi:hypothetical protein